VTRDALVGCVGGRNDSCSSSCAVTVRRLLREPGRAGGGSTSGGTAGAPNPNPCPDPDPASCSCVCVGPGRGRVALQLRRLAARRRRDWERARVMRVGAVSPSDSVSEEAGEGESESASRSSSVHVWWPAAATRESGLGCGRETESAARDTACAVGDTAEADGRELMSLSLSLDDESSNVPSPTWRKLGVLEFSFGKRDGLETEGRWRDVAARGRLARKAVVEGRRAKIVGERAEVVDGVLSAD
jgi:hypothetical protein